MKGAGELNRLVLPSSRRQWEQTYRPIDHPSKPAYFTFLRDIASSVAAPASQAAAEMYESANGQMTVTFQQSYYYYYCYYYYYRCRCMYVWGSVSGSTVAEPTMKGLYHCQYPRRRRVDYDLYVVRVSQSF